MFLSLATLLIASFPATAPALQGGGPATVIGQSKISNLSGGLPTSIGPNARFGAGLAWIPDLDGQGTEALAVGEFTAPGGGQFRILGLDPNGQVTFESIITAGQVGAQGFFASAIEYLGDLDGDGMVELAVGDRKHMGSTGAVWIVTIDPTGNFLSASVINNTHLQVLNTGDEFGQGLAYLGDIDGDGGAEFAVGAHGTNVGTPNSTGAVWIVSLTPATVFKSAVLVTQGAGGFSGSLGGADGFGVDVAPLGDINGDGYVDIAVGAFGDSAGTPSNGYGAVWILFLGLGGSGQVQVVGHSKIDAAPSGVMSGLLSVGDGFGLGVAAAGDLNGDCVPDLAIGASGDDGVVPGSNQGAVWCVFLTPTGAVSGLQKINTAVGGFTGPLAVDDEFGVRTEFIGDLDGDGYRHLAVAAPLTDDLVNNSGAVWILELDGPQLGHTSIYGCGVNPPGSLVVLAGAATPGSEVLLGVDNPAGTQAPGAMPIVALATAPAVGFPCGVLIPGWGMSGPFGESLLDVATVLSPRFGGDPWAGPSVPAEVAIAVPASCGILGVALYAQGALIDPAGPVFVGLTDAARIQIGVPL